MTARPYSPETLAERWACSAEKIRTMYRDGELSGFRLGKLIRIPANEVERYECQTTHSHGIEESLHSPSEREGAGYESRLARQTKPLHSPALPKSGNGETQQQAKG